MSVNARFPELSLKRVSRNRCFHSPYLQGQLLGEPLSRANAARLDLSCLSDRLELSSLRAEAEWSVALSPLFNPRPTRGGKIGQRFFDSPCGGL